MMMGDSGNDSVVGGSGYSDGGNDNDAVVMVVG